MLPFERVKTTDTITSSAETIKWSLTVGSSHLLHTKQSNILEKILIAICNPTHFYIYTMETEGTFRAR